MTDADTRRTPGVSPSSSTARPLDRSTVVVPADGEPGQPVGDAASRGQEQHRGNVKC